MKNQSIAVQYNSTKNACALTAAGISEALIEAGLLRLTYYFLCADSFIIR